MHTRLRSDLLCSLLLAGLGCGEWPRFAHLPESTGALEAALDTQVEEPPEAVVSWGTATAEAEPNDTIGTALSLALGEGIQVEGTLSGTGWDHSAEVDPVDSGCTQGAFPPYQPGDYAGDVDWLLVLPDQGGVLCLAVRFEEEAAAQGLYFDLVTYTLDGCAEPESALQDLETGQTAGLSRAPAGDGSAEQWAVAASGARAHGLVLAGFLPSDLGTSFGYSLAVALLASEEEGSCPSPWSP